MRPVAQSIAFRREDLPPFAVLEGQWRALAATACPSFFTSWHWVGTLLAALPETSRPSLLRGTIGGSTAALALLGERRAARRHGLIRSRTLYLNETGDPGFDLTIEHNGLLAAATHEQAVFDGLTKWFAALSADELHIAGSLRRIPQPVVEGRGLVRHESAAPSYWVALDRLRASDGALYPVLSANARQQLRRAIRHYERLGPLEIMRASTIAEAHAFFTELKALHAASWVRRGRTHSFSRPFFEAFHRLLIERSFAAGAIELLKVSAGQQVIGYLYNFRLDNRIYAYQSGFAYDDPAARPGAVAHAMAIRDAYRSGASIYDFLAGHNRLKASFATDCAPMLWQVIQRPRLAFRLEHLARGIKRRAEAALSGARRRKKMLLPSGQHDTQ